MEESFESRFREEINGLNPVQREAVFHGEGSALCIAGPGSGKTRVISLRALRLSMENGMRRARGGFSEKAVLTLAFNRHACLEMEERTRNYLERIPEGTERDSFGEQCDFATVHGYCYGLIRRFRRERGLPALKVIGQEEREQVLEELYRELSGTDRPERAKMKRLSLFVSSEEEGQAKGEEEPYFAGVLAGFRKYKEERNLLDFGDMLVMTERLLEERPDFCREVRESYRMTQVDEAQDVSPIQGRILRKIAPENVFYVADDDQSIYGFRGAEPRLVLEFRRNYGGKLYMLEENFRSRREIVRVASEFIRGNQSRFDKKLFAFSDRKGSVRIRRFDSVEDQAAFAVKFLCRNAGKGKTTGILYRNNSSALPVLGALYPVLMRKKTVPTVRVSGERMQVSNLPAADRLCEYLREAQEKNGLPVVRLLRAAEENGLFSLMLEQGGLSGRRRFLIYGVGCYLKELACGTERWEDYRQAIRNADSLGAGAEERPDVSFSTVHSAKGLEYDSVLILDCVEGEFPYGAAAGRPVPEEERRLMYVALTRAKNEVILCVPARCGSRILQESRFVEELETLLP